MKGLLWSDTRMLIADFCRPSPEALKGYAEWYKAQALYMTKDALPINLKYFALRDIKGVVGDRRPDGSTPSDNNSVWFVSEAEIAAILRIEAKRMKAVADKTAADETASQAKINVAIGQAKTSGKLVEIDRYTVDCRGGEPDCSFDLCVVSLDAEGVKHYQYAHCF